MKTRAIIALSFLISSSFAREKYLAADIAKHTHLKIATLEKTPFHHVYKATTDIGKVLYLRHHYRGQDLETLKEIEEYLRYKNAPIITSTEYYQLTAPNNFISVVHLPDDYWHVDNEPVFKELGKFNAQLFFDTGVIPATTRPQSYLYRRDGLTLITTQYDYDIGRAHNQLRIEASKLPAKTTLEFSLFTPVPTSEENLIGYYQSFDETWKKLSGQDLGFKLSQRFTRPNETLFYMTAASEANEVAFFLQPSPQVAIATNWIGFREIDLPHLDEYIQRVRSTPGGYIPYIILEFIIDNAPAAWIQANIETLLWRPSGEDLTLIFGILNHKEVYIPKHLLYFRDKHLNNSNCTQPLRAIIKTP